MASERPVSSIDKASADALATILMEVCEENRGLAVKAGVHFPSYRAGVQMCAQTLRAIGERSAS